MTLRSDSASQSVCTVLALLAALSELASVKMQAHLVMYRALIPQVLCETPALLVMNVWIPGVEMCLFAGVEHMAHFVLMARCVCTELVFLPSALQWSSKAGTASQGHRSAWPGRCASAGGGSGR